MKHLPLHLASPTPLPVDLIDQIQLLPIYKAFPFLLMVPQTVLWGFIGSLITVIIRYLYGLVHEHQVMTVKITVMNALHEMQIRMEGIINKKFEELSKAQTEQMIEIVGLRHNVERITREFKLKTANTEKR